MKVCRLEEVALGEGRVWAFTLFECKRLCSVIFYKWETIDQVRFHSHAFPAIAFLLWGHYHEKRIVNGRIEDNHVRRLWWPRYLPRNYTHSIKRAAPLTLSVVFVGPWSKTWREYFDETKTWVTYTWGRKVVDKRAGRLEE